MDPRATPSIAAAEVDAAKANRQPTGSLSLLACHFRWVICTRLLLGVTKNYMDRQVLGVLKTTLQHDLGWNEIDYGNLIFAFQTTYAIGMLVMGRLIHRLGPRVGHELAIVFWSLPSMANAL